MISVVDNLLLLWYIGYNLAEYWFATGGDNVWLSVHSDSENDVYDDCVVNYVWHYVTVCTNNLGFADFCRSNSSS